MKIRKTSKWTRRKKGTASTAKALVTYGSGLHLFSKKFVGKLPYADSINLPVGVSDIPYTYRYRLTSIYDPDFQVGGHQPRYHDQLEQFYSQYRVIGAKMRVVFSLANPTGVGMTVGLRTSSGTGNDPTNHVEMLERPDVKHVILNSQRPTASRTIFYSAKKVYGKGDMDALTAQFGFNPQEEYYGNIHTVNTFPGGTPQQINVQVHVTYIVLLTERKQITAST